MLRSKTIEKILMARHVVRFVVDEAHCFSSWGQDFRVDYLYIGKFISEYQKRKQLQRPIPVSCFTATAKQKVVQDICDYFKQTLNLDLQLFASSASRTNLRYSVIHAETDEDKYMKLRSLIAESDCPTIVFSIVFERSISGAIYSSEASPLCTRSIANERLMGSSSPLMVTASVMPRSARLSTWSFISDCRGDMTTVMP